MRYAVIAVLVLAVAAGLSSWGYVQAYSALQVSKDQVSTLTTALKAEQARTARIQQTVSELEKRNAPARQKLQLVLDANRDWSDASVPAAVADSLCSRPGVRCAVRSPTD